MVQHDDQGGDTTQPVQSGQARGRRSARPAFHCPFCK